MAYPDGDFHPPLRLGAPIYKAFHRMLFDGASGRAFLTSTSRRRPPYTGASGESDRPTFGRRATGTALYMVRHTEISKIVLFFKLHWTRPRSVLIPRQAQAVYATLPCAG